MKLSKDMKELCSVRGIAYDEDAPALAVGDILARDGAWQRKYRVEYIVEQPPRGNAQSATIGVRPLGNFYADGRIKLAAKHTDVTEQFCTRHFYNGVWGEWAVRGFMRVVPAGTKAKLRVVK